MEYAEICDALRGSSINAVAMAARGLASECGVSRSGQYDFAFRHSFTSRARAAGSVVAGAGGARLPTAAVERV